MSDVSVGLVDGQPGGQLAGPLVAAGQQPEHAVLRQRQVGRGVVLQHPAQPGDRERGGLDHSVVRIPNGSTCNNTVESPGDQPDQASPIRRARGAIGWPAPRVPPASGGAAERGDGADDEQGGGDEHDRAARGEPPLAGGGEADDREAAPNAEAEQHRRAERRVQRCAAPTGSTISADTSRTPTMRIPATTVTAVRPARTGSAPSTGRPATRAASSSSTTANIARQPRPSTPTITTPRTATVHGVAAARP